MVLYRYFNYVFKYFSIPESGSFVVHGRATFLTLRPLQTTKELLKNPNKNQIVAVSYFSKVGGDYTQILLIF